MRKQKPKKLDFGALLISANKGDWEAFGQNVEAAAKDERAVAWAKKQVFESTLSSQRQAAAYILVAYAKDEPFEDELSSRLEDRMKVDSDQYVRFRLAIALAVSGYKSPAIFAMLQKARAGDNDDIAATAKICLDQLAA